MSEDKTTLIKKDAQGAFESDILAAIGTDEDDGMVMPTAPTAPTAPVPTAPVSIAPADVKLVVVERTASGAAPEEHFDDNLLDDETTKIRTFLMIMGSINTILDTSKIDAELKYLHGLWKRVAKPEVRTANGLWIVTVKVRVPKNTLEIMFQEGRNKT
jgi:hypothetical protein